MPVTDGERVNVFDRRVMGATDFATRVLDLLEDGQIRLTQSLCTGADPEAAAGTWFESVTAADGTSLNKLSWGDMHGTDGTGQIISVESGDARITDVPFQDTAATTYYMATRVAEVPEGVVAGTDGSGQIKYDRHRFDIGHRAAPTAVVVGGSTLTLTLGNHALHASDDFTGRTAVVFLAGDPESAVAATAIEEVTVSGQTVTTTGHLGQSSPSSTPADYEVVLLGPTVTRSNTVQTAARWAFIGTVVGGGAPRTFDTSTQPAIVPMNELSSSFASLLAKGWTGLPSVTNGGTSLTIGSTGVAFSNGRLIPTPTGKVFSSLPASGDVFLYYSIITGNFLSTTSWDTANNGTNIPLFWAYTAASTVVHSAIIGRRVAKFNESLLLTLSSDSAHSAAFRTLPEALAAARAAQKGSTIGAPGIVIEVVGDVNVSASINEVEYYDVINLTIRGASRGGTATKAGGRIRWNFTGAGLFEVPTGAVLNNWTFRDLCFEANGIAAAAKCAVVSAVGSGSVTGCFFDRCIVDGNGNFSGSGGGTGRLPYLFYSESSGSLSFIYAEDCVVNTVDGVIRVTSASPGIDDLRVRAVNHDQSSVVHISTVGFIRDEGTSPSRWRISDCYVDDVGGPCIRASGLADSWIFNNIFMTEGDFDVIDIGNTSFNNVSRVFLHSNIIEQNVSGGVSTSRLVRIRGADASVATGIVVHSNIFRGDATINGTASAVVIDSGSAADLSGVIVHSNAISRVAVGVDLLNQVRKSIVAANVLDVDDVGIRGLNTSGSNVLLGNWIAIDDSGGTGIILDGADTVDDAWMVVGNLVVSANGAHGITVDVDGSVIVGNNFHSETADTGIGIPIALTADEVVLVGNRTSGGAVSTYATGASNLVAAGNLFGTGLTLSGDGAALGGNKINGTLTIGGDLQAIAGNQLEALAWTGTPVEVVVTGNRVAGATTMLGTDAIAVGNLFEEFTDTVSASARFIVVGNHIREGTTVTFENDDGTIVGNRFAGDLTLGASSTNLAAAANRIAGATFIDSGAGNTTTGANDI